jgi:hypothetical protein
MKIKGHVVVSHMCGGSSDDRYRIVLEDFDAGIQFAELSLTGAQLASALTGTYTQCEITVRGLENVGKMMESVVDVVPGRPPSQPEEFRSWLAQMRTELHRTLADGWFNANGDYNYHNNSEAGYRLHFYHFVTKPKNKKTEKPVDTKEDLS